ncbi:MAG: holo-[acyl-carrier-protein] synthase [Desulfovibrionales bacterium]|nr:holo-[acyl-carrier-protein] synthase [Desulfovibrionales bacterium]
MIVGLGIDTTELDRIRTAYERHKERFTSRILHTNEIAVLPKHPVPFLAARFAAKEAAVKALGTGFTQGIQFQDIEIQSDISGKPILKLHNKAADVASALSATTYHISLTHGRDTASAVVILESL